ncbi:MAG TPA: GNVR domain-containing protein [Ignavibacteria bacterium]|nr:GNVR domain-containing protein [Ignavibacteria bacterium]
MKPIFLSTGIVKSSSTTSGLSGLLGGVGLGDFSDIGDIAGSTSSAKELALYENILISRRNILETIQKFNLNNEWNYSKIDDAIKFFRDNLLEIKINRLAGTMSIGVYNEDPILAKDITEFMIFNLNKINIEMNIQSAKSNKEFIESRYNEIKITLANYEDSLKNYQNIFGISPDLTVKAAVQSELLLESEIKTEEVKLELLSKILSPNESEVKLQVDKINALKSKLEQMNSENFSEGKLNLKGSPEIILQFLRLQRNVEIQNRILTFILPIYEQAKIEEKRETPTVLVLDNPFIPDKKAKPKRIIVVGLITFGGMFVLISFLFVKDKWKKMNLK